MDNILLIFNKNVIYKVTVPYKDIKEVVWCDSVN